MHDDIHPIAPPPGTVPDGLAPYQPPRRRLGLLAASVVLAAGVGAGGFAVSQLASQHQGVAVSTSQGAEDGGGAVENADAPAPAPAPAPATGEHEDD
jgi:hypothetical protein